MNIYEQVQKATTLDMVEMNKELIYEAKADINNAFAEYQAALDKAYNDFLSVSPDKVSFDEISYHKRSAELAMWLQRIVTYATETINEETKKLESNTKALSEMQGA